MPPWLRRIGIRAGWLAIPASLFLLSGCGTTEPAQAGNPPLSITTAEGREDPYAQVFGEEADVHILAFFDLYCVACQQSAQNLARLDEVARSLGSARVTGIGFGDTAFEMEVFLKRYPLPYGCVADPDKAFEAPFHLRGTPTVLGFVRMGEECREVYRHESRFRSEDLELLRKALQDRLSD